MDSVTLTTQVRAVIARLDGQDLRWFGLILWIRGYF